MTRAATLPAWVPALRITCGPLEKAARDHPGQFQSGVLENGWQLGVMCDPATGARHFRFRRLNDGGIAIEDFLKGAERIASWLVDATPLQVTPPCAGDLWFEYCLSLPSPPPVPMPAPPLETP